MKARNQKMQAGTVFQAPPNGCITNWSGVLLDPKIRAHLASGQIVRICGGPYVRIQKTCRNPQWLNGQVEDPYVDDFSWHQNGEKITFHRKWVSEIPLDWKGNTALKKRAILREKGVGFTGAFY